MSHLEERLALLLESAGLPTPEREYQFHPTRRWRFDFAWPAQKLAVEVEGGIWHQGRHTRGLGFQRDCVKYNEAALMGWRVLRMTEAQIDRGRAVSWVRRGLVEHRGDIDA